VTVSIQPTLQPPLTRSESRAPAPVVRRTDVEDEVYEYEDDAPEVEELEIRASYPLYGFVAAGSAVAAIGFAWSAASGGGGATGMLRWFAAGGFAVLALVAIRVLLVQPMLVADRTGIRLRVQDDWVGARWDEIDEVTVLPRRHLLDDGRIAVHLEDPAPVLGSMSSAARRRTDANRRLTGSSLAVPFGLASRVSDPDVLRVLQELAGRQCTVHEQP
jgi:hypothetical protein